MSSRGRMKKYTNICKLEFIIRTEQPCASKIIYKTKKDAVLFAKKFASIPKERRAIGMGGKVYEYECRHCGGWHLSSRKTFKKRINKPTSQRGQS